MNTSTTSTLITHAGKISREELALIPTPEGTATHRPVPHHQVVQALAETLGFRHIGGWHADPPRKGGWRAG